MTEIGKPVLSEEEEADLIVEKLKTAGDQKYKYDPNSMLVDFYFSITPVRAVEYIYVKMIINGKEVTIDAGSGS